MAGWRVRVETRSRVFSHTRALTRLGAVRTGAPSRYQGIDRHHRAMDHLQPLSSTDLGTLERHAIEQAMRDTSDEPRSTREHRTSDGAQLKGCVLRLASSQQQQEWTRNAGSEPGAQGDTFWQTRQAAWYTVLVRGSQR